MQAVVRSVIGVVLTPLRFLMMPFRFALRPVGRLFSRLGIMTKAMMAPGFLILLLVVIGSVAVFFQQGVNRDMEHVSGNLVAAGNAATNLLDAIYSERLAAEQFLENPGNLNRDMWRGVRNESESYLDMARYSIVDPDRQAMLEDLAAQHAGFSSVFGEEVVPTAMSAQETLTTEIQPLLAEIAGIMQEVVERQVQRGVAALTHQTGTVSYDILDTHTAFTQYVSSGRRGDFGMAMERFEATDAALNELMMHVYHQNDVDAVENAIELWADYGAAIQAYREADASARNLVQTELSAVGREMVNSAQGLQRSAMDSLNEVTVQVTDAGGRAQWIITALLIGGVVVGGLFAWFLTRGYVRPLVGTNEFLGSVVDDMDAGRGDLTRRVEVRSRDEVGQLGHNINRFIETLQRVVGTINTETTQLASAAEELSAVTGQTTEGAERQRGESEQVATAITEMTATVQEVARNATDASTAAEEANGSAAEGRRVVGETVEAINALVEAVQEGQRTVGQVGSDAEGITEVVDVIQAVAEQTNLLALNAAIEAARAGEEGRGFAVVAAEVRDLAKKTQDSTVKIQELIENLQTGTRGAVEVMRQSGERGEKTMESAAAAGTALERIEEQVRIINDMNAQIASAAEEQTAVTEDISGSVERIRGVSDETAQAAVQTSTASGDLAKLAERLNGLVKQFRI